MNLFFDECVSAKAAVYFRDETDHAVVHPRDAGMCGKLDPEILTYCLDHDLLLVTVNGRDFRKLCGTDDTVHSGLIIIPSLTRENQIKFIQIVLDFIAEKEADWMVNKVVEIDADGRIEYHDLPSER